MKRNLYYLGIFFLLTVSSANGQKLKYKNIFPLLQAKNYAQGEPQLRQFLTDPKNQEEPNAHLQFGYILESHAEKLNVVTDSIALIRYSDSIAIAFNKAKLLIDDKEIRKNEDYYQQFHRRDLRTGDFGIKLSDIQLELDNKIERYRLVSRKTKQLAGSLPGLQSTYEKSNEIYKNLTKQFKTENALALSANQEIQGLLKELISNGEEIRDMVDNIQDIAATHPRADYNASSEWSKIETYAVDGSSMINVYEGHYVFWDYKKFAEDMLRKVDSEIKQFKHDLIETDKNLSNKLATVERAETLFELPEIPAELEKQIIDIDPDGLAGNILRFKKHEIAFKNIELIDEDSAFVTRQMSKVDTLYEIINKMDAIFAKVKASNSEEEKAKYESYVKAVFGRNTQVNKYVQEKEVWLKNRRAILDRSFDYWSEVDSWAIGENYRIPLFEPETMEGYDLNYLTVMKVEDPDYNLNVFGFQVEDTPYKSYLARVSKDRKILWVDRFQLQSTSTESLLENYEFEVLPSEDDRITYSLSFEDGINKPFYRYACYMKEGKKLWEHKFELETPPFNVKFNDLTKETIIYLNDPDNLPAGEALEYIVIDRAGKVRK